MIEKPDGRRARNKADKLHRIRTAARELFIEKGYDGATMRDLAARSGVGFGTIFDYASSKRDLLFLIFNPDLVTTLDEAYAEALEQADYIDQLMCVFGGFYRLYQRDPELSRYLLRELNFYQEGAEAAKFLAQRADFMNRVCLLTATAQSRGALSDDVAPDLIARILFSTFAWEVRRWIGSDPLILDRGLSDLRLLISVQTRGFRRGS